MRLDKTEFAYMAGIMDGEGSFSVSYSPKYKAFVSDIGFVQTVEMLPKLFQDRFGGSLRLIQRKNNRHKPVYRWRIYGHRNVEKFLLALIPYLKLKKRQAELALEFHRLGRTHQTTRRHEIVEELHRLNRRGKSVEANTLSGGNTPKIESDLHGDMQSATSVMAIA